MRQGWKSRLFGDNNFNFYAWIFTGLIVVIGSMACAVMGIMHGNLNLILAAINLTLLGVFAIMLQNYHSRLAEKLDSKEE